MFAKLFVDHTEGIASSWDYIGDSINKYFSCRFTGMSYDEEDNMYLTGYPTGTYLVKINFERGVSVVRKVVKS